MATTPYQTLLTNADPNVKQLEKRDLISDMIRYKKAGNAPLLAFVAKGVMGNNKVKYSKGMIAKRSTDSNKIEQYIQDQVDHNLTISSVSSLNVTVTDVSSVNIRDIFFDPIAKKNGMVVAINTSTKVVTFEAIDSGFAPANVAGNPLLSNSNAHEDGTQSLAIVHKDPESIENYLQEHRFGIKMGWQNDSTAYIAGGDKMSRHKMYRTDEAMELIDRSLYLGSKPASGYSTAISALSVNIPTAGGMRSFVSNTFDFVNSITREKLLIDMPDQISTFVKDSDRKILALGDAAFREITRIINAENNVQHTSEGFDKTIGLTTHKLFTHRGAIEIVKYNLFNQPGMTGEGFLFVPEEWVYCFKKNHDIAPRPNIENGIDHFHLWELTGMNTILPKEGGSNGMIISNLV